MFSVSKGCFGIAQDNKLSKAFELFDDKRYVEAEPLFKELINEKPESLGLYYYYGACRTENKNYSEYDLIQLLNANPREAPLKINYYLGIQYQAQENWDQALKHFNKFRMDSTPEEQEKLGIAAKIQDCYNHENPYKKLVKQVTESSPAEVQDESLQAGNTNIDTTYLGPDSANYAPKDFLQEETQSGPIKTGTPIEFIVNSRITYYNTNHFQTEEGRILFNESQVKQQHLDSILNKTDELRAEYLSANNSDKIALGKKIVTLETESYPLKEEITRLLLQAQNKEIEYWDSISNDEIERFAERIENENEKENQLPEPAETVEKAVAPDTALINPEIFLSEENHEILLEEPMQKEELVYRIQIGAYSKGLPSYVEKLYKKLSVIRKIDNYTDENGIVVYTTGRLTNLEDAKKLQEQVRQEGVEDAFIVPYFNGKRITLEEAKKIKGEL